MSSGLVRSFVRTAIVCGLALGPFAHAASAATVPSAQYPSIQSAINAVLNGSLPDGTTIDVQPGTYFEALIVANTSRSLTVRGTGGAGSTIVDAVGKSAAAVNVFRATGNVTFSGLTFRRGAVGGTTSGGGFVIQESSPDFIGCIFEQNSAYNGGGGALITSNATFTGCTIRNNSARHFGGGVFIVSGSRPVFTATDVLSNASGTGGSGGGGNDGAGGGVFSNDASPTFHGGHVNANTSMFAAGGVFHMGVLNSPFGRAMLAMDDVEVADNVSSQFPGEPNPAEGGGMHVEDIATATLTRVHILRNRAGTGGGLNAYRGRYDVVDSVIDGNQASAGFGGGVSTSNNNATAQFPASIINLTTTLVRNNTAPIGGGIAVVGDNFSSQRATLSIANSVVAGNQSQNQGGGVLVNRGNVTVTGSMIINNVVSGTQTAFGGGILITTTSSASFTNATIAHNTASVHGGGIFVNDTASITMTGSNVYDNTAGTRGAGLFIGGGISGSVQNSVFADNTGQQTAGQINEDACSGVTYTNNVITATTFSGCAPGGRATGTSSGPPRFAKFLAVPSAGASTTLAWSVARATSVTVANIGTWNSPNNSPTGTVDVTPASSTTFSLTATATSPNGGNYSAVTANFTSIAPPSPPPPGRSVDGDFDGDRRADITVFRPGNGTWYHYYIGTGATAGFQWGNGSDIPVAGDYDGDGKADNAVFRPANGTWYIRYATGATAGFQWGNGSDKPVPADYDGDGKTDIAVFRPSNGTWYIQYATGATAGFQWGNGSDVPLPGDYDGDGKADLAVFRPSNGTWYIWYATGATAGFAWGNSNDIPVPGDYDGDGKTDVAVFRPSQGIWYVRYSSNGSTAGFQWGNGNDIPVPGDYDGDGRTDTAVFRPSSGVWFIVYSSSGAQVGVQWGNSSDIPILRRN